MILLWITKWFDAFFYKFKYFFHKLQQIRRRFLTWAVHAYFHTAPILNILLLFLKVLISLCKLIRLQSFEWCCPLPILPSYRGKDNPRSLSSNFYEPVSESVFRLASHQCAILLFPSITVSATDALSKILYWFRMALWCCGEKLVSRGWMSETPLKSTKSILPFSWLRSAMTSGRELIRKTFKCVFIFCSISLKQYSWRDLLRVLDWILNIKF